VHSHLKVLEKNKDKMNAQNMVVFLTCTKKIRIKMFETFPSLPHIQTTTCSHKLFSNCKLDTTFTKSTRKWGCMSNLIALLQSYGYLKFWDTICLEIENKSQESCKLS
jgi:hypothetical protein